MHDRVVDIADDDEAALLRRNEHPPLRPHRRIGCEFEIHDVPIVLAGGHVRGFEAHPEIAVAVGHGGRLGSAETRDDGRIGDLAPADAPGDVTQVGGDVVGLEVRVAARLPEDPADQEDLSGRAVAPIGLDHCPARPLRPAYRAGDEGQQATARLAPARRRPFGGRRG